MLNDFFFPTKKENCSAKKILKLFSACCLFESIKWKARALVKWTYDASEVKYDCVYHLSCLVQTLTWNISPPFPCPYNGYVSVPQLLLLPYLALNVKVICVSPNTAVLAGLDQGKEKAGLLWHIALVLFQKWEVFGWFADAYIFSSVENVAVIRISYGHKPWEQQRLHDAYSSMLNS